MSTAIATVISTPSFEITQEIDQIYHSETPDDMRLKIALLGHSFTLQSYMALCDTLCYHYGFWPHTRPRFESFKRLMKCKTEAANPFIGLFKKEAAIVVDTMAKVVDSLAVEYENGPSYNKIPGRRNEIFAWKMLLKLARNLEEYLIVVDERKKRNDIQKI